MTRVNVVDPRSLCNKHLLAEWREMPRVVSSLNKSLNRKSKPFSTAEIKSSYTLGAGHVKFFFNKFKYLHRRHKQLTSELLSRGFSLSTTDSNIFSTVDKTWYNDWTPTQKDIDLNVQRILQRMPNNPKYTLSTGA